MHEEDLIARDIGKLDSRCLDLAVGNFFKRRVAGMMVVETWIVTGRTVTAEQGPSAVCRTVLIRSVQSVAVKIVRLPN